MVSAVRKESMTELSATNKGQAPAHHARRDMVGYNLLSGRETMNSLRPCEIGANGNGKEVVQALNPCSD